MSRNSYPTEGVKEKTTVQPEGDLGAAGRDRESPSPTYMPRRRPEPLTGPTSQEGYRQTAQAESNGCQGGPIHDPASEQHHRGVHGPSVLFSSALRTQLDLRSTYGREASGENAQNHRRNLRDPGSCDLPKTHTLTLEEWRAQQVGA